MAVECGQRRGEGVQLSPGEEAAVRQRGVERARRVALAEDKPVTLGEQRMHRIDVKYGCVKRHQDVSDREVAAEVTEPGPVDHVQVVAADAVGHLAQDRRGLGRCQPRELRAQGHEAESLCRISRQHVNIDSDLIFHAPSELARDLLWCQVPLAIARDRYTTESPRQEGGGAVVSRTISRGAAEVRTERLRPSILSPRSRAAVAPRSWAAWSTLVRLSGALAARVVLS